MSDRVHTVTFNSSSGSASFAIQRKQQASVMPSAALCTPLPSNGASIPVVGSAKVGCPVDARSVEARRLVQFSFSACALSHVREPMVGVCALYIAQLTWVAVSPGMESRPQHRTSVGGGTAWHRCDYGEKNAEGFFVQLKLQVVCSLRTVPDRVAHSPRYTLRSQNKASPEKFHRFLSARVAFRCHATAFTTADPQTRW